MSRANEQLKQAFKSWWQEEGCKGPSDGDWEVYCERMCEIAWSNGAYKAVEQVTAQAYSYVANEYAAVIVPQLIYMGCNRDLADQGRHYPRTCQQCGHGPCTKITKGSPP